jgi:cytochrome c556
MPSKHLFVPALAAILLAACSGPVEDTLPGQPIKHRQEAFKEILRNFEPMGTMLRTNRYEADSFADMAARLVSRRDGPWEYFTDGSFQPPTRAKQAVWSRAEDFAGKRTSFIEATDALLEAANGRELANVRAAYSAVENTCRSCHDDFRN